MNASELMIGDHVFFLGHVHQIRAIEHKPEDNLSTIMFYGKNKVITTTKEVEPIPLTAEILEKNGFECEQMEFWRAVWNTYKIADNLYIAICGDMRLCGYYVTQRNESDYIHDMFKIDYIHQLQHALKLCGLTDLANNFKV